MFDSDVLPRRECQRFANLGNREGDAPSWWPEPRHAYTMSSTPLRLRARARALNVSKFLTGSVLWPPIACLGRFAPVFSLARDVPFRQVRVEWLCPAPPAAAGGGDTLASRSVAGRHARARSSEPGLHERADMASDAVTARLSMAMEGTTAIARCAGGAGGAHHGYHPPRSCGMTARDRTR